MKGLLCWVYRKAGQDCTNNGISSKHSKIILTGEGIPEIFEPNEDTPRMIFVDNYGGYAEPPFRPEGAGWMFGGNFLYSSDSRFPRRHPIRIHDRQESWKDYDALTR